MSKEQWFREFERALAEGIPYDQAAEVARERQRDAILDKADELRQREKDERGT